MESMPVLESTTTTTPGQPSRMPEIVRRVLGIDATSLLCCVLCSLTLILWGRYVASPVLPEGWAFLFLFPWTVYLLGRRILSVLDLQTAPVHPFPLAFLTGCVFAFFALFALDLVSPLTMRGNGIVILLATLLANAALPNRLVQPRDWRQKGLAVLVVFFSLAAATMWTQHLRPYLREQGDQIIIRPLPDGLTHAQIAAQLMADKSLPRLGNADFAGLGLPLYHYVIYTLPASYAAWTGQTALDAVYFIWTPFSIVLAGLAAFSLAATWWGAASGLAALIGVLLVPDACTHGLRIMWLSYHYFTALSPGLHYGAASMTVAMILITRGIRPAHWQWIVVGFGLALCSLLMKAQVFLVSVPLLALWFLLFQNAWSWQLRLGLGLGLAAGAAGVVVVADRLGVGPAVLPIGRPFGLTPYWQSIYEIISSPRWKEWLAPLATADSLFQYPLRTAILILGGSFGVLLLFAGLVYLVGAWRHRLEPIDAIPLLAVAIYLASNFFFARNDRSHPDELTHRQFSWVYYLLAVWSWGKLVSLLGGLPRLTEWRLTAALAVLGLVLFWHPYRVGKVLDRTRASWHEPYINMPVPRGLVDCCTWIRTHSHPEDIIQAKPMKHFVLVGGFCERRCYLGRSHEFWAESCPASVANPESARREELLRQLRGATTSAEIEKLAQQTGIRWYIAEPQEELRWPAALQNAAAYHSGNYKVFDLASLGSPQTMRPGTAD